MPITLLRRFARSPALSTAALLAVALGIGANTAILSVVDATRLQPLPFDDASSLVSVWLEPGGPAEDTRADLTGADLVDLRAEPGLFAALAGWRGTQPSYVGLSTQEILEAAEVTAGMFSGVLRVHPFLGRAFLAEEDRPGAAPSVVLSHAFWTEEYGSEPGAIGRSVVLDGTPHVVVGVMPPGFRPPFRPDAELWTPARLGARRCRGGCATVTAVGRLATGTGLEVARDRATALGHRLAESYPETNRAVVPAVDVLSDPRIRMSPRTTRLLLSAGALVLLLACSNVALLLLARGVDRSKELGIRRTVGASRWVVVRQLLAESMGLAMVGAALGVGVAVWVLAAIERSAPAELLAGVALGIDRAVLAWVALLTVGTGVTFGLIPALMGSREPGPMTRIPLVRSVGTVRAARFMRGAVGALQLGLATILVIGAGGLLRSLHSATGEALGFDPADVVTVRVDLSPTPFVDAADRSERVAVVTARLEGVPGVFSVGASGSLPFDDPDAAVAMRAKEDDATPGGLSGTVRVRAVSPAYFYTMEQRLSEGRWFRPEDDAGAAPVAILSTTAARRFFDDPPRSPIDAEVALGDGPRTWRTVVGVVRDEWADSELMPVEAIAYVPMSQAVPEAASFVARVGGDPSAVVGEIRDALGEVDAILKSAEVVPLETRVQQAYAGERFGALLATSFAVLALLISLIGLFGILAHSVVTRVREWGLRRAVGATDEEVRGRIVARGVGLAVVGVALGGVGSALFVEGLDTTFSGAGLRTPMVYAAAVTLLAIVVLAASVWPAHRSVSVDVVSALRAD